MHYVNITSVSPGVLENVGIVTGGNNYKVNEFPLFQRHISNGKIPSNSFRKIIPLHCDDEGI